MFLWKPDWSIGHAFIKQYLWNSISALSNKMHKYIPAFAHMYRCNHICTISKLSKMNWHNKTPVQKEEQRVKAHRQLGKRSLYVFCKSSCFYRFFVSNLFLYKLIYYFFTKGIEFNLYKVCNSKHKELKTNTDIFHYLVPSPHFDWKLSFKYLGYRHRSIL